MLSNSAPISIAPYLFDKPPYDPLKDFVHVAYIGWGGQGSIGHIIGEMFR